MSHEAQAKQASGSGAATEHATTGDAAEHAASASGSATEHASFKTGAKDPCLEKLFQGACADAPPKVQSVLQQLHALGQYPKRYKQPANKMEKDSSSLAKRLTEVRSSFTPAAQKYVEAVQSNSTATEHAEKAEALMQQVRALGHMPKESQDPTESRLAHDLRKARTTGSMSVHEPWI